MMWNSPKIDQFLLDMLEEDLGQGDIIGEALLRYAPEQAGQWVELHVVPRESCVLSGMRAVERLVELSKLTIEWTPQAVDGQRVQAGTPIASINGHLAHVLAVERSALNLLQLLCGVATHTAKFVKTLEGTASRLVHTRKTIPNMRMLQQQAVLDGGGFAHRYNLSHAAMFKDNLLHAAGLSFKELAEIVRKRLPHTAKLEIECDHLEQVSLALDAGAEVIMLDNMNLDEIRRATSIINGRVVIEVSGGITLANIRAYAEAGADVISTSQITMNAPAIDIGLDAL